MTPETKRTLIATSRRIIFTGVIILGAWLILLLLRQAIPSSTIDLMISEQSRLIGRDPLTWDWAKSLWTQRSVADQIGLTWGTTMKLIGLGGLISLVLAAMLLTLGYFIGRITRRPTWLAGATSIFRLILVSGGISIPIFAVSTFFIVFAIDRWHWTAPLDSPLQYFWASWYIALLPAWLLVQHGHSLLSNKSNAMSFNMVGHIGIGLIARLFKLVGIFIVVAILVEQSFIQPGLGRLFVSSVSMRDFPVLFGVSFTLVIVVALSKLVGDLIEIAHNYYSPPLGSQEQISIAVKTKTGIPKIWVILSLIFAGVTMLVALVGPLMAPYGFNEIRLAERLAAPSAQHFLGTDNLGRDVLTRLLYGIRMDLLVGLACVAINGLVATAWSMLAAALKRANTWLGDTLEDLVMLPRDILCAFPWLVLLFLPASMLRIGDYGVLFVILISSIVLLPHAVGAMQEAYNSSPAGKNWLQSIIRAIPIMLVFTVAGSIFYVSTLGYLGWGVPPPTPELGSLLTNSGRQYMLMAPWMARWPVIILCLLLVIWVMVGDGLLETMKFRSKAVWAKMME